MTVGKIFGEFDCSPHFQVIKTSKYTKNAHVFGI